MRLRHSEGKTTVVDGPFTEAKELIAGFALLEVKSKKEAVDAVTRFLRIAGDGESEIRQIMEPKEIFTMRKSRLAGCCARAARSKCRAHRALFVVIVKSGSHPLLIS